MSETPNETPNPIEKVGKFFKETGKNIKELVAPDPTKKFNQLWDKVTALNIPAEGMALPILKQRDDWYITEVRIFPWAIDNVPWKSWKFYIEETYDVNAGSQIIKKQTNILPPDASNKKFRLKSTTEYIASHNPTKEEKEQELSNGAAIRTMKLIEKRIKKQEKSNKDISQSLTENDEDAEADQLLNQLESGVV